MSTKTCPSCKETKESSDFYRNASASDGLQCWCISCMKARSKTPEVKAKQKAYYHKTKDEHVGRNLKRLYGISWEDYSNLLAKQDRVCAICGAAESGSQQGSRLRVDHCHITGKVRGLLCHHCNSALGGFKDSPTLLTSAIDYVRKHSS